ncbi:MAG: endonuclease III domain-containing protein [Endomicrobiia bacterium]|nr:endonuclease III domain-containing protein [Endomicrobiia bacterium]
MKKTARKKRPASPLPEIYRVLLGAYGRQGWWPVTPRGKKRPEYSCPKRPSSRESLEIAVGAILTQNTSWSNVERAVENLNRTGFFCRPFSFPDALLKKTIRPSGYYNQKAVYVRNFLDVVKKDFGGDIKRLFAVEGGRLRRILLDVKGIGPETADSIILYAARKPVFVIDAYTMRIMRRAGLLSGSAGYERARAFFETSLPRSVGIYSEYHALLVRQGKEYCHKKNPLCAACPLFGKSMCPGVRRGQ